MSSQEPSGADQIDAEHPSRNRKVEGSNLSSGSKTAGQRLYLAPADCTVAAGGHSFGLDHRAAGACPLRYVGVRPINSAPVDGPPSSAHSGRNHGGRTNGVGPAGRARYRAQLEKTSLPLRRHFHISDISPVATYRHLMERDANFLAAIIVWNDPWWFGVAGRCCNRPAAIGEEDSMGSDHHFTSTDGHSGPSCGGRSVLGLVPQLEAGALGRLRLDHNLRGWSVCWPPGRLGL